MEYELLINNSIRLLINELFVFSDFSGLFRLILEVERDKQLELSRFIGSIIGILNNGLKGLSIAFFFEFESIREKE